MEIWVTTSRRDAARFAKKIGGTVVELREKNELEEAYIECALRTARLAGWEVL